MSFDRIRRLAGRPYPGRIELAALAALYGVYELVRGFGGEDWAAARAHTADVVALERRLHLFVERDVQDVGGSGARAPAPPRRSRPPPPPSAPPRPPQPSASGFTSGARTRFRSSARR